jgi:hypothetical protein
MVDGLCNWPEFVDAVAVITVRVRHDHRVDAPNLGIQQLLA